MKTAEIRRGAGVLSLRRMKSIRQARGVTLFEVLIVVAIMAMISAGVTVVVLPKWQQSQRTQAETDARTLRAAIQTWQAANNEVSCPTISQLVQDKQLDRGQRTNDPWDQPYTLTCADDDVIVTSNGPDKKKGTKDDISIPKGATAATE